MKRLSPSIERSLPCKDCYFRTLDPDVEELIDMLESACICGNHSIDIWFIDQSCQNCSGYLQDPRLFTSGRNRKTH